jgi:hypothetical protein
LLIVLQSASLRLIMNNEKEIVLIALCYSLLNVMASKGKRPPSAPLLRVISDADKNKLKSHFTNKQVEIMTREQQLDHCSLLADRNLEVKLWDGLNSDQIKRQVSPLTNPAFI